MPPKTTTRRRSSSPPSTNTRPAWGSSSNARRTPSPGSRRTPSPGSRGSRDEKKQTTPQLPQTPLELGSHLSKYATDKVLKASQNINIHLNGPLLFTAPHEIALCQPRKHFYVEEHTSAIATKLAAYCEKQGIGAGYCTWDLKKCRPKDPMNLDPNYLTEEIFETSPFHWAVKNHHDRITAKVHLTYYIHAFIDMSCYCSDEQDCI